MYLNDNETIIDLIQYEPVARSVVALLGKTRGSPITIGVHGDWGAGKSSVLAMVQEGLKGSPKTLCLRFNGWTFQGFDDAKSGAHRFNLPSAIGPLADIAATRSGDTGI